MEHVHTYVNFDKATDYIAVDFDGTLHDRTNHAFDDLGPPILLMLDRVKKWLEDGMQVKLLTARVSDAPRRGLNPSDVPEYVARQRKLLEAWCLKHIGQVIPITAQKDTYLYQLWDDRAVAIERNTGKVLGMNKEW